MAISSPKGGPGRAIWTVCGRAGNSSLLVGFSVGLNAFFR